MSCNNLFLADQTRLFDWGNRQMTENTIRAKPRKSTARDRLSEMEFNKSRTKCSILFRFVLFHPENHMRSTGPEGAKCSVCQTDARTLAIPFCLSRSKREQLSIYQTNGSMRHMTDMAKISFTHPGKLRYQVGKLYCLQNKKSPSHLSL